jgi:hypothetical protein
MKTGNIVGSCLKITMTANVDRLTGRRKPSRVSRTANRLEDQASEHEKGDKHRKPSKQVQDVRSQDMCNSPH